MGRHLVLLVVGAVFVVGPALAGATAGPQKAITPEDQARARVVLVKRSDLGAGFEALPGSGNVRTCPGLDLGRVTVTGEASSPAWIRARTVVFGSSVVYASTADARLSLDVQAGREGLACSLEQTRRTYRGPGVSVSQRRLDLPRLAPSTLAYRTVVREGERITFAIDSLVLRRGRGQTAIALGTGGALPPRSELLRLGRLLAARLQRAMRAA